jgi:hypothetical protein
MLVIKTPNWGMRGGGDNKGQKERTHVHASKTKTINYVWAQVRGVGKSHVPDLSHKVRGVGKSHVPDLSHKKHIRKGEGTHTRKKHIMACFTIDVACICCNIDNTLSL